MDRSYIKQKPFVNSTLILTFWCDRCTRFPVGKSAVYFTVGRDYLYELSLAQTLTLLGTQKRSCPRGKIYLTRLMDSSIGPPRLPLWGGYWILLKENYNFTHLGLKTLADKYKTKILGLYFGGLPTVCALDMEHCKQILTRPEFLGKADGIIVRARGNGKRVGIFFVDDAYWKDQRWFSLRYLRDFGFGRRCENVEGFTMDQVKDMIDLLQRDPKPEEMDICRWKGEIDMPDVFFGYYLNCIWYILSGRQHNLKDLRDVGRMAQGFQRAGDVLGGAISITPWLRYIAPTYFGYTSAVVDNRNMFLYCQKVVDEHMATYSDDYHRDFIDVYIGEVKKLEQDNIQKTSFSVEQMTYIVMDYMFPASVALGHTTNFYFAYILNNPEIQMKIHEEIDRVVGRNRLPSLDDRKNMPYTEASIREVLRKDPANPLVLTRLCTEDTTLGGYFIPKGTLVIPNIYAAQNDPKVWGDPENFKPERWLDEEGNLKRHDPTMGFGAGKRLCAGETFARQTMFLFVTSLMQNFTLLPGRGESKPSLDLDKRIYGINVSLYNYWMRAEPRA